MSVGYMPKMSQSSSTASLLKITGFLWMTVPLLRFAFYLPSCECICLFSLSLPHFPWESHSVCTNTYFSQTDSWFRRSHGIVLPVQRSIFWQICACTPTARKLCYVITQSMLEILFTLAPKGSSAPGPLTSDIASAFVYPQKSIGGHLGVRGI